MPSTKLTWRPGSVNGRYDSTDGNWIIFTVYRPSLVSTEDCPRVSAYMLVSLGDEQGKGAFTRRFETLQGAQDEAQAIVDALERETEVSP